MDLSRAERHERAGEFEDALRAYREAQQQCRGVRSKRHRRETCSAAYLHHAELLDRLGRGAEAALAFDEAERVLELEESRAAALFHAGRIELGLGQDTEAYRRLWRCVTDYPDTAYAADAIELVVRDGRNRDPAQLYQVLESLREPLADTDIGDNVEYWMATLAEEVFHDPRRALLHWDEIWQRHPQSGLRDESRFHGARLARALGDGAGAAKRLKELQATREVAIGAGSYFSVWLDDGLLELGKVLRDDLGDLPGAINTFSRMPRDYPASILRDDALYELVVTYLAAANPTKACAALVSLRKSFPDSKYVLAGTRPALDELRCDDANR